MVLLVAVVVGFLVLTYKLQLCGPPDRQAIMVAKQVSIQSHYCAVRGKRWRRRGWKRRPSWRKDSRGVRGGE